MKILWVINTILPYVAKKENMKATVFGGWLNSLFDEMKNNDKIKQMIIVSMYNGTSVKKYIDGNVIYYLMPTKNKLKYNKNLKNMFINIYNETNPDLVHIHGTEYPHSLSAVEACVYSNIKSIVSIQGLISICGKNKNYFAGMSFIDKIRNITIRDIIKKDLLLFQAYKFRKRGKYEIECLKNADYIIGRTSWDYANSINITNCNKYVKCNESLRNVFYTKTWDINNISRYTIFISQASYPLKGFHNLLESIKLIKKSYPNIKVYIAGTDIIYSKSKTLKEKIKLTGYGKYLRKKIREYNLSENVIFTGLLDEKQLLSKLLNCHVYVQASSMENSSNSLGEAMLIGMPCVASCVGGTSDMLNDKEEGFLYPFNSPELLTKYVMDIFNNDELAINLGNNARKHALNTHNILNNINCMLNIYKEVIDKCE